MSWIKKVRAIGGLLAIVVLLGMISMDFLYDSLIVTDRTILLLASLISGLLGIDVLVTQKSRIVSAIVAGIEEYVEQGENE